jgi:hypothetical protein
MELKEGRRLQDHGFAERCLATNTDRTVRKLGGIRSQAKVLKYSNREPLVAWQEKRLQKI